MKIHVKRQIDAPKEAIWAYLSDFSNIYKFHPLLKDSHSHGGDVACEIGSTRQCDMKDGSMLRERITDVVEGTSYTVEITETNMPIKEANATLGVRETTPGRSEAFMHMELTPKYKVLTPIMYVLFRFIGAPSILRGLENQYKKDQKLAIA